MKHPDSSVAFGIAVVGLCACAAFLSVAPRPQQSLSPAGRGAEHIKTHVEGCKECQRWLSDGMERVFDRRWNERWEIVRRGTRYSALPGVSK